MTEIIIGGLIAGVFTIAGVLLGQYLSRKNTIELMKLQDALKATSDFRNAFLDTKYSLLSAIEIPDRRWKTIDIVENDYPVHERAYFRFRESLVARDERIALDNAWSEYVCKPPKDKPEYKLFDDYYPLDKQTGLAGRTEEDCKKLARDRIDKLLKLTK